MSILDTDIAKTDALLKYKANDRVMMWLAHSLSYENFAVLCKKRVIIPNYEHYVENKSMFRTDRGIWACDNKSKVHYIDGIAFSFVDVIWNEETGRWVVTPKDPTKPIFLIVENPIPEDIYFPPKTLIYPSMKTNNHCVLMDSRFKFVNPYRSIDGTYEYVDYFESLEM